MPKPRSRLSLEYFRKQAKSLTKAHRAGDSGGVQRAERVLGERAKQRFLLSDAQHVVAVEAGFRSWAELRHQAGTRPLTDGEDGRLLAMRLQLSLASWSTRGEIVLEAGIVYLPGSPVRTVIRKREWRYDINDTGTAVRLAGRPAGWHAIARQIVEAEGYNVNRRGVIFVPAVEGRDLAYLAWRLAGISQAVFQELLEIEAVGAPPAERAIRSGS